MNHPPSVLFQTVAVHGLSAHPVTVSANVLREHDRSGRKILLDVRCPERNALSLHLLPRWRDVVTRVRSALDRSGVTTEGCHVEVIVSCTDGIEPGPTVDLAVACAIAHAVGHVDLTRLTDRVLLGELRLDGKIHGGRGLALAARYVADPQRRVPGGLLTSSDEGAQIAALGTYFDAPMRTTGSLVELFADVAQGGPGGVVVPECKAPAAVPTRDPSPVFSRLTDAAGLRAVLCAAAGEHGVFFVPLGAAATSTYARAIADALPPLGAAAALEVLCVQSSCGFPAEGAPSTPFRAPHHTVSVVGLRGTVDAALNARAGEIARANHGVLYLSEAAEFSPDARESVREALDTGAVRAGSPRREAVFPARFILAASSERCLCGATTPSMCVCETDKVMQLRQRARPIADLCDIVTTLRRGEGPATDETDTQVRETVRRARERAIARQGVVNGRLATDAPALGPVLAMIDTMGAILVGDRTPVARVARTLADLADRDEVTVDDVRDAVAMRGALG